MTEQINTPELRFPEFKEKWKEFSLEDKSDLITKGTTPKVWDKNGEVNFIKVENIEEHSGKVKTTSKISYHEHSTHLKRSILEEGDILFSIAGTLGRITIINKKILPANTNQALAIIRNTSINKYYLKTYLLGKSIKEYIRKNPTVGAQPNLSLKQIKSFKIKTPDFIEQEKIGIFFSKLDQQIELEEKKLELLEQQKRGYMQKIFSQEMRFKDENNNSYPDWEIKKLEEIAEFQNGKAHENFVSNTGKFILVNSKFISTESKVKKYVDKQLTPLEINDIAIVMSDVPNGKALAKCYLIEKENTYSLNQRIGRIFNIEGNSRFLYTQINRNKQLLKYDSGVGQTNLKKSEIIGIKIYWPNKEEQNKIGAFFLKLDSIIEKQSTKLELLKHRKKGLLQKMFV